MNKRMITIMLTAALLAGCANKGSDSKGYADLDSIREEQQEFAESQSVFEFSQSGSFEYDDKPENIMKNCMTELDSHIFWSAMYNCVIDTETDRITHLCRIAGCAHSDNSPGCLDHLRIGGAVATSKGLYYVDDSKLMLFDGSEQSLVYVSRFSTDYSQKTYPECPKLLGGLMIQNGKGYLLGADYYMTFDYENGKPTGEPVILTDDSTIYSYCANSEYMFYSTENNELFSCHLSDSKMTKLDDKVGQVCVFDDRLYYVKWEGEVPTLMRTDKDGKNAEALIKDCYVNYVITDKAVYYTHYDQEDAGIVYMYELATGQTKQVDISSKLSYKDPAGDSEISVSYPQSPHSSFAPYMIWNKKNDKVYILDRISAFNEFGTFALTNRAAMFVFKNGTTEFEVKTVE